MRNRRPHVVENIQYSFIPNRRETMLALARAKFTSQEWRVIIALLNQTDGYRREHDEISSRFWQAITFMSREVIARTLNGLLERGIMGKENKEGAIFYRLNHPNDWPLEAFAPQHLSGKALKQAQELYHKEKEKGKFLWLKRLLGSYRDQPVTLLDSDSSSDSFPEESAKPGLPQKSVTNQSHKRDQPVTVACPTSHALNAPKESLKKASKESLEEGAPFGASTSASRYLFEKTGRKRWSNLLQKSEFESTETEVGFERMKNAIDWALLSGISNIKSMLTAARKERRSHGEQGQGIRALGRGPEKGEGKPYRNAEERAASWDPNKPSR